MKKILTTIFLLFSLSVFSNVEDSISIIKYDDRVKIVSEYDIIEVNVYNIGDTPFGSTNYEPKIFYKKIVPDVNEILLFIEENMTTVFFIEIKTNCGTFIEKIK